jgi:hypothetical protein
MAFAAMPHLVEGLCLHAPFRKFSYLPCKSKAVPLHAMEALGVRGGIASTHT